MIFNTLFPILSAMLEGYTSERLRDLIFLLNDPEINQDYGKSNWVDPKRKPMQILNSLNRRNMHRHIQIIINYVLENMPNKSRMPVNEYNDKKKRLINQLKTFGISYENGVLKTSFPNPHETNQNIEDIIYLLKQNNYTKILNLFEDYLKDYAANPNTSLGKLRTVFEKIIEEIVSISPKKINNMKDKIKELQILKKLPITTKKGNFLDHFYGIYACLSDWGSHGAINDNYLLSYITTTSIGAILLLLRNI